MERPIALTITLYRYKYRLLGSKLYPSLAPSPPIMARANANSDAAAPQTLRRLMKEYDSICADSEGGIGSNPDLLELRPWDADGEDLFEWYAVIRGPSGGYYEGEKLCG